jgi:UDP-3-O-[3-hydroxymyristoyl] glucosamine N-acyltransferase
MSYTIGQIAALLGLEYQGEGTRLLSRVSRLETADEASLVFWESDELGTFRSGFRQAACVLIPRRLAPSGINVIFSDRPKLDFARAASFLHPRPVSRGTRHPTACIAPGAEIDESVELGPFVIVEARARIGKGSILEAGATIGEECCLGRECILHPGVVLYPGVHLGDRVILHAGVVVGSDGFGYVYDGHSQWKFPQVGAVVIEDDVEIGSNSTIDRGSLGTTRIGAGSKVDNLVQIAHNVEIGKNVVIAAQTGISGSTIIEDNAVIGGQVGFGDHARVQRGAVIGSKSGVLPGKIVRSGDVYWGVPVRPLREYKRLNALFGRLPEMKAELDQLKREVAQLQAALRDSQSESK